MHGCRKSEASGWPSGIASGWLTQTSLVTFCIASGWLSQFLLVLSILPVGRLHVASGWLRLVLVCGCFCFPVLVLSDWAALGLKRATPKGCVCFVLGQTEI